MCRKLCNYFSCKKFSCITLDKFAQNRQMPTFLDKIYQPTTPFYKESRVSSWSSKLDQANSLFYCNLFIPLETSILMFSQLGTKAKLNDADRKFRKFSASALLSCSEPNFLLVNPKEREICSFRLRVSLHR